MIRKIDSNSRVVLAVRHCAFARWMSEPVEDAKSGLTPRFTNAGVQGSSTCHIRKTENQISCVDSYDRLRSGPVRADFRSVSNYWPVFPQLYGVFWPCAEFHPTDTMCPWVDYPVLSCFPQRQQLRKTRCYSPGTVFRITFKQAFKSQ